MAVAAKKRGRKPAKTADASKDRASVCEKRKGKPHLFTPEKGQQILDIIEKSCGTITGAALAVGVSEATVHNWRKQAEAGSTHPGLVEWAEQLKGAGKRAEEKLRNELTAIASGMVLDRETLEGPATPVRYETADQPRIMARLKAVTWLLEHRWPNLYGPHATGPEPEDEDSEDPTPEQYRARFVRRLGKLTRSNAPPATIVAAIHEASRLLKLDREPEDEGAPDVPVALEQLQAIVSAHGYELRKK